MKYNFNRSKDKINIYNSGLLEQLFKGFNDLKFKKEVFSCFDKYATSTNIVDVDKTEIKGKSTKILRKAVNLNVDTVIVLSYRAIDDVGTLPEGLSLKLSIHLDNGKAKIKHYLYDESITNHEYEYFNFLANNDSIGVSSKLEDANGCLSKINDIFNKINTHSSPTAFVSKNELRCVLLKLLEHDFNLKVFPDNIENTDSKDIKPKKSKGDLEEHFKQIYSVHELKELLVAIDDKYGDVVKKEKEELGIDSLEEKVKDVTSLLKVTKTEIESIRPEFMELKNAWIKEKKSLESKYGDDLKKIDEMYASSEIRKDAIVLSEKIKNLTAKQKDLGASLEDVKTELVQKSSKLKETKIYFAKRKYVEGLLSVAEKEVASSVEKELSSEAIVEIFNKSEKLKNSYLGTFNDKMSTNAKGFIQKNILPISQPVQRTKKSKPQ